MRLTKILAAGFLSGASVLALVPAHAATNDAGAQDDSTAVKKHHHHAAPSTGSDRLELLERQVEQQQQEIQDLKAQVGGGGQVSSSQFEALQNQVFETQATVKAATANQAAVRFNHSHLTISSPDGKYTFSPFVLVQGDFASFSKGDPLHNTVSADKDPLKSSGENFRRAQIGFQGTFAGDFGYAFVYDFGGTNGDETYQGFAGPHDGRHGLHDEHGHRHRPARPAGVAELQRHPRSVHVQARRLRDARQPERHDGLGRPFV